MIYSLLKKLSNCMEYLAALALILMMLHVLMDVLGRHLINMPAPATTEIVAYYYMVAAVFLPLPFVELKDKAIVVDLFFNMFSPIWKRIAQGIGTLLGVVFFAALAMKSSTDALAAYEKGEMIDGLYQVMIWPARFGLPVSFALTALILSYRFVTETILGLSFVDEDEEDEQRLVEEGIE
ncbi:TRAP transporter small permease [Terasakiella pusilla]|uniref:TRAP transporter small permease n=1 Tax=Terasakiella pusilla TaxID=64973 RepID=UPI003AA8AFB8